jgi:hypothetical protein
VRKHLLAALQLADRPQEFVELTRQQQFVLGRAVWDNLSVIKAQVRAESQAKNKLENKRRRSKRGP